MAFNITEIRINEMIEPLGIDVKNPVFSWKMISDEKATYQTKYKVLVGSENGFDDYWNSGMCESDNSIAVSYEGKPLKAETRFFVTVQVWNQNNQMTSMGTWFETGMMSGKIESWDGAQWIGSPEYCIASDTMSVFVIESTIQILDGIRAGIVFGVNDERLLDIEKNELGLAGENYISYVMNIDASPAQLEIYRVGYSKEDKKEVPFAVIRVVDIESGQEVFTEENKREKHKLTVEVTGNCAYVYVDDVKVDEVERMTFMGVQKGPRQLNPLGDNDTTSFPRLCQIGYYVGENSKAFFDGLHVRNLRSPHAEIISLDTDTGKVMMGEQLETIDPSKGALPMLRTEFTVFKKVKRARLYATARGIYECCMNGSQVGDQFFAPGASQFDKHLNYQTYDVTDQIAAGVNVWSSTLASGWWMDSFSYTLTNYNYWGDQVSFLGKLVLTYEDGTKEVIVTDETNWKCFGDGPYRYAGFFNGEHFDGRKADMYKAFSLPEFDKDVLVPVTVVEPVSIPESPQTIAVAQPWPAVNETVPKLVGHYQAPVKAVEVLNAVSMTEPADGIYIYDMGQEVAGVPCIGLTGKSGEQVRFRYGEMLYPNLEEYGDLAGRMLQVNLREASNTDIYICSGEGLEVYQPKFTFHGYRYIEISGIETPPAIEYVQSIALSSVEDITGAFSCSHELVNKLVSNVTYSQRSNFISIPTDCPQRNERMGWVGDTHVFCRTAIYQSNTKNFYLRNLQAMKDLQSDDGRLPDIAPFGGGFGGIVYESAMILVTWELYQQYGDITVVEEYYDAMNLWMKAMEKAGLPGMLNEFGLGDWLATEETDPHLIWNAFHYRNAKIMSVYANKLGKNDDELRYEKIAAETKKYWNEFFVEAETGYSRSADGRINDTQGSYSIALSCDVYNEDNKKLGYAHLARKTREANCTVQTGFFGTGPLNPMLSEGGYEDLAQKTITQTMYPSWLYPITQGATTIWERWNSFTTEHGFGGNNSMNSFNHYSLGSVVSWLYENVLGIHRDETQPGYKHFILRPETGTFAYAKGHIETPHGTIKSEWTLKGEEIVYQCEIPANTTATLQFGEVDKELGSGCYEFRKEINYEI